MVKKEEGKKINLDLIILVVAAVVVLVICLGYQLINHILINPIDGDKVAQITVYYNATPYVLDESNTDRFIELYNSSRYLEKDNGQIGTTPVSHTVIYFDNGKHTTVSDYGGGKFAVSSPDSEFFIHNKELLTFLSAEIP